MKWLFIILSLFLLVAPGCGRKKDSERNNYIKEHIRYMKDKRTNLCFAVVYLYNKLGLAEVPCNKVKHLLIQSE